MLGSIKDAFHRWVNRLFHRSDRRRPNHSTSNRGRISSYANQNHKENGATKRNSIQPSSKLGNLPQETSALDTGTNADEQHQISPLTKGPHQFPSTLDAQTKSAIENQAPLFDGRKASASSQSSRNATRDSQVTDAAVSKNQPLPLRRQPQDTQDHGHHEVYIDHSVHARPAVIQQEIKPHIHTIYEPRRTRSIHVHEHRMLIQPIVDPASTITSVND